MANIAQPSVQSLLIEMQFNGRSTGTAFVVQTAKGPHLITNRHNVTGRRPGYKRPLSPRGRTKRIVIARNRKNLLGQWELKKESLYKLTTLRVGLSIQLSAPNRFCCSSAYGFS